MTRQVILLLLSLTPSVISEHNNTTNPVTYYVDLINTARDEAFSYQLPADNRNFSNGGNLQQGQEKLRYDFVVVGAGTSGSVVSRRLSDFGWRVLLLEAGGNETDFSDVPYTFRYLQNSHFNWGYNTTPQHYACQAMINRQCAYPRGKVLGGSGVINGMTYVRSVEADHTRWRDELGLVDWSWPDVLPYYRKLENTRNLDGWTIDPKYRGLNGPVNLDYSRPSDYSVNVFLEANAEMGIVTKDYNGQVQMGAGKTQFTKYHGRRGSNNKYYLHHADRSKLRIITKAYVTDLVFDKSNRRVVGVNFVKDGYKYAAESEVEVILSAGAVNSPQIMMLSGIGPKQHLESLDIPVVADLPVGQDLQDHIGFFGMNLQTNVEITPNKTMEQFVWDFLCGTGILTETGLQAVSYISSQDNETVDLENMFLPSGNPITPEINGYNLAPDAIKTYQLPADVQNKLVNVIVMPLHPKSRGSITLKSNDPYEFPNIDPNSLSDPADMDVMLSGIEYFLKLLDTDAFKKVGGKLIKQILPACASYEYKSKEFWKCTVQQMSHTIYHPMGTCKMGINPKRSVVDSRLRVHGIKGLRIVDLSVVPLIHSGHPAALGTMIGERAADYINTDYANKLNKLRKHKPT